MTQHSRHRVLVVDDSAFARKVLREILSADERLEVVGFARDGLDALEKINELKPDAITLDLVMPELDGVGVLEALNGRPPAERPRVVVVTMTDADSVLGVAALDAGAFDIVHKPTAMATDRLYELKTELLEKVVLAARSDARRQRLQPAPTPIRLPAARSKAAAAPAAAKLVVIGASTGGPRALADILTALPADFPAPIAAVVHMPVGYTEAFANRLNASAAIEIREAFPGARLEPGKAFIARAGMHLRLSREGESLIATLDARSDSALHRPSVDALFESAAEHIGADVLGVVLTGMGSDGLEGARAIHRARGRLLVEAESSCIVYGMPRAVAEAGIGAEIVPLELMAKTILDRV